MNWVSEKHRINENVELTSFRTDKFKTGVLKLSIINPASSDKHEAAKFSLLVNLLRSGTEKYPEKEDIIKRLNELYDAACSIGGYASGDNRILEISSEMLDERFSLGESIFDGVLEVMDQMLLHPFLDDDGYFRADVVEREKNVICDKIKSEKNNTRDYALRKCREIMCAGEPYGTTISSELIKALTREEMTAFYRSFLASSNISFSYVGALDGNVVAKRIERIFKDLPNGKNSEIAPLMLYPAKDFKLIEEEMNVKQGVLVIGMRTGTLLGEYDAPVMTVFNNVYGGTYMSRLFKTVREKMSLCYYCSSDFISTKAVMYVSCGIDVANFERAKDEILAQLEMLKREHVTDEELAVAKDLAVKELREMTDYPSAIATFSYSRDIYGIKDTIESLSEKIEKVSSDDILRVANKIEPSAVFFLKGIKNDEAEEEDFYGE
jgi:predicted Zn-dependent peptidase